MKQSALCLLVLLAGACGAYTQEDAVKFLVEYNTKSAALWSADVYADWDNTVNITDENNKKSIATRKAYDEYQIQTYPEVLKFPWQNFTDPLVKRQFKFLSHLDEAVLSPEKRTRHNTLIQYMTGNYSETKVKEFNTSKTEATLTLEDVEAKLAASNNPCEMSYYWDAWQTKAGRSVKTLFEEYVGLENEIGVLNNFTNGAARWKEVFYEIDKIDSVLAQLLKNFKPLFQHLHAYIRRQLWLVHGKNSEVIDLKGPIPASLLGNVFGLDGINIFNKTAPYPKKPTVDVSDAIKAQKYNGMKMARSADKYYTSMGFAPMPERFWKYSVFEKPADRDNIDCSDQGWRFFNDSDYRIKICAQQTMDDFGRVHHEMGHLLNYMIWKDLPYLFQDAPNRGFDELISDMMYLFVTGPTHLKSVGLLDPSFQLGKEQQINALYLQALSIVFFLPYAYSMDVWRWKVLDGSISKENYNCEYWKIRLDAQGVSPPVDRDENDFDPGAKYHVVANYQYMMYFISGILEFQLHNSLCQTAGKYDPKNTNGNPVYLCDIANSTAAGDKLRGMISLGKSHPWPDALEKVTGSRTMDAKALVAYFQPLYEWLQAENKRTNQTLGWTTKHTRCQKKGEKKVDPSNKCVYSGH